MQWDVIQPWKERNADSNYKIDEPENKEDRHKRSYTLGFYLYEIFSVTKSVVTEISGFWGLEKWIIGVSVDSHKICCGVITFI